MDEHFVEAFGRLATHPELGKQSSIASTREVVPHESYRMVYEVLQGAVWILVLHTARL